MGRFALVSLGWLILAISLSGAGAENNCLFGWYLYNNNCYKVFSELKAWNDAEVFCMAQNPGCHLASIHSEVEAVVLADYFYHVPNYGNVWIGLWDPLEHRIWQWSDCSRANYKSWDYGQPDNYGGNEHCVELRAGSGFLRWNDLNCDHQLPLFCECPLLIQSKIMENNQTSV